MEIIGYEITVKEIVSGERKSKDYQRLHSKQEFDSKEDPEYGYVTEVLPYTETRTVYEQSKSSKVNLMSIIEAFNEESQEKKA